MVEAQTQSNVAMSDEQSQPSGASEAQALDELIADARARIVGFKARLDVEEDRLTELLARRARTTGEWPVRHADAHD